MSVSCASEGIVSEHAPRMEQCEEDSGCLWGNSQETRVSGPQCLQTQNCFGRVFMLLPRAAAVIQSNVWTTLSTPLWKSVFCHLLLSLWLHTVCAPESFTQGCLLTLRYNLSDTRIKLAIAWDLSPPRWLAPFSQVTPPLGWWQRWILWTSLRDVSFHGVLEIEPRFSARATGARFFIFTASFYL